MVILNNSAKDIENYSLERYKESLAGYTSVVDIISKKQFSSLKSLYLKGNTALIIKLKA